MKIHRLIILFFIIAFTSYSQTKKETEKENSNIIIWRNIESTTPIGTMDEWNDPNSKSNAIDTAFMLKLEKIGADFSNMNIGIEAKTKIIKPIFDAVYEGKLKAYYDYPEEIYSLKDVKQRLVQWDSTTQFEDPKQPGTFIWAPTKIELTALDVTSIVFHEDIIFDKNKLTFSKKINFISVYVYKRTESGVAAGTMKLFDIKLNE